MGSISRRKVLILGTMLVASLMMGCYGPGWGGGGPVYYSGGEGPGYYSGGGGPVFYSNSAYRGYDRYPEPGMNRSVFGGYAPANEAWAASSRGRSSYGEGGARSGGHSGGGGGGHAGGTGGGAGHGGGGGHGR
jgi:hypothetical protein